LNKPFIEAIGLSPSSYDDATEQQIIGTLYDFDEALRTGNVQLSDLPNLPDEHWLHFEQATRCLLELEAAFPRRAARLRQQLSQHVPKRIGRFEISERLGAGGYGLVFKGFDTTLQRTVAVKVPRDWVLDSPDAMARFARESQAAAKLDHPSIVPIYEAGQDGSLPYIAYAFCEGPNLGAWIKEKEGQMLPVQAVKLVILIARAIDFCHQAGVLHRDIKPGNVLLFPTTLSDIEGFPFTPKVADLGLAKLIHSGLDETATKTLIGTPLYMAPEQATGDEIGPEADVYSIGATLYMLLVGRSPFVANSITELLAQLATHEPVAPIDLNPSIARDLNTICLKCLEKDPGRRYRSASELADDLQRWLDHQPITARPASARYRLVRWCKRNSTLAISIGSAAVLMICLFGSLIWNLYTQLRFENELTAQNQQLTQTVTKLNQSLTATEQQRSIAAANRLRALQVLYASDVKNAAELMQRNDPRSAANLLTRKELNGFDREFTWRFLHGLMTADHREIASVDQSIWCSSVSADKRFIAVGGNRGFVHLFNGKPPFQLLREWPTGQIEVNGVSFSRNGKWLATAGDDGRVGLWDVDTGAHIKWFNVLEEGLVYGVQFFEDDAKLVACGTSPQLYVMETETSSKIQVISTPHVQTIESLALSHGGGLLATAGADGRVTVFDVKNWTVKTSLNNHYGNVVAVQFSVDDSLFVSGGSDGTVRVYDGSRFNQITQMHFHDAIASIALSEENRLAVSDRGGVIRLIDLPVHLSQATKQDDDSTNQFEQLGLCWVSRESPVYGLQFVDSVKALFSADRNGSIRTWGLDQTPAIQSYFLNPTKPTDAHARLSAGTSPGCFYAAIDKGLLRLDMHDTIQSTALLDGKSLFCSHDHGDASLVVAEDHRVAVVDIETLDHVRWIKVDSESAIRNADIAPNGWDTVILNDAEQLVVTDIASGKERLRLVNQSCFAISPDGRWLVAASHGSNTCSVHEMETMTKVADCSAQTSTIREIAFSPDNHFFACASDDRTVMLTEVGSWKLLEHLQGHTSAVKSVAISPDSQTIASGDERGVIKLWHFHSGQELLELVTKPETVHELAFSAEGNHLAAWVGNQTIHFYTVRGSAR
jgi:WD40 repeat protein